MRQDVNAAIRWDRNRGKGDRSDSTFRRHLDSVPISKLRQGIQFIPDDAIEPVLYAVGSVARADMSGGEFDRLLEGKFRPAAVGDRNLLDRLVIWHAESTLATWNQAGVRWWLRRLPPPGLMASRSPSRRR